MDLATLSAQGLDRRREAESLLDYNPHIAGFGLALGREEAIVLLERRDVALVQSGRLEFGESVVKKLLLAFRDSPFLLPNRLGETLGELTELFYLYKNECMDALTDDELLERMRAAFDGPCQGSVELMGGRELWTGAYNLRQGRPWDWAEPEGGSVDDEWN